MIWKRKNRDVIDLTDYYKKQQERKENIQNSIDSAPQNESVVNPQEESSGGMFGFFSAGSSKPEESSGYVDMSSGMASSDSMDEKRKRLAKRIADMTSQLENLSNQVYQLQQRLEVLERKDEVGY